MTCPEYRNCQCWECDKVECPYWTDKMPEWITELKEILGIEDTGRNN